MGFLLPTGAATQNGKINIFTDRAIIITDDQGVQYDFGSDFMRFTAVPDREKRERRTITTRGLRKNRTIPMGWHGEFTYGRNNGAIERFQLAKDARFRANGDEPMFTIATITRNIIDGSIDNFSFIQATLNITTTGEWAPNSDIEIAFEFEAMDCVDEDNQLVTNGFSL